VDDVGGDDPIVELDDVGDEPGLLVADNVVEEADAKVIHVWSPLVRDKCPVIICLRLIMKCSSSTEE